MTSSTTRAAAAALALPVILTLLAACGAGTDPSASPTVGPSGSAPSGGGAEQCETGGAVVIVLGAHQGFASGLPPQLACAVGTAMKAGKPVTVVTSEGVPHVLVASLVVPNTSNSEENRDREVAKAMTAFKQRVDAAAVPSSDGDDLVSALDVAADLAHGSGADNVQMYVVDSGLTDTGAVQMTLPGALIADPAEVAAQVVDQRQCPDLHGITVRTLGFGYGVDPQPLLTPADRAIVTATWGGVVSACGGRIVDVPGPLTGSGPATSFHVTPVQPSGYALPPPPQKNKPAKPVVFRGGSELGFEKDSTKFADPDQARDVLSKIAEQMQTNPTWHLDVTGTTANGPTRWPSLKDLGKARAKAVKKALVRLKVPSGRISATGHGYTANPPQVDARTAALNRTISLRYRVAG